jgi:uncharacterized protein (DUF885 family)
MKMSHNDTKTATAIIEALNANSSLTATLAWKEHNPATIDELFDKLFLVYVAYDPQLISKLGLFEPLGIREHNAHLTDVSPEIMFHLLEAKKKLLEQLNIYTTASMTHEQVVSHKIFSWMLNHELAGEPFILHDYKINQMTGTLSDLTLLFTQIHLLKTTDDVRNYISRLTKIPAQLDQAVRMLQLQEKKGILPPRFTIEKVIATITQSLPEKPTNHLFYQHLAEQIAATTIDNQALLLAQAEEAITQSVIPAYNALLNQFKQLLELAHDNHGLWALPQGEAYYTYMLKFHTTTDLSADEIHNLGLKEVAQIQQAMRSILTTVGRTDATKPLGELMQELAQDRQFYYTNDDAGRAACLNDYRRILGRSRTALAHLFDIKPTTGVRIERMPLNEEAGNPAAYYCEPSIDGSRPGTFFANLRDMNELPKYGMETLTIHEAEPGHHFQIALQQEMDMPILRKMAIYTAYVEGWALYTEKLAYEEGFYSSPYMQLGHLQDELLRAARLVVDTGIHAKRWSREKAIEYMKETTGYHHNAAVTEVERYFVLPGQACAYKIGQLKILELRQRAKDALEKKFDIKKFHNVILTTGAVPLDILEEVIDQYIHDELVVR